MQYSPPTRPRNDNNYDKHLQRYSGSGATPVDAEFRETQRMRAENLGLSQRAIGRKVGLSHVWISRVWNEHTPGAKTWRKIAALLDAIEEKRGEDTTTPGTDGQQS